MTSGALRCRRLSDVLRLHLGVTGVKQPHPVSMLAQDRRQSLDSQGRKRHHLEAFLVRRCSMQFRGKQPAKVLVPDVHHENIHGKILRTGRRDNGRTG